MERLGVDSVGEFYLSFDFGSARFGHDEQIFGRVPGSEILRRKRMDTGGPQKVFLRPSGVPLQVHMRAWSNTQSCPDDLIRRPQNVWTVYQTFVSGHLKSVGFLSSACLSLLSMQGISAFARCLWSGVVSFSVRRLLL